MTGLENEAEGSTIANATRHGSGTIEYQPPVALGDCDLEWGVSHPLPWVTPVLGIGRRTSPVLLKEQSQPHFSWTEVVVRVERPQFRVACDTGVELLREPAEGFVSSHLVIEGLRCHEKSLSAQIGCRSHLVKPARCRKKDHLAERGSRRRPERP